MYAARQYIAVPKACHERRGRATTYARDAKELVEHIMATWGSSSTMLSTR